MSVKLGGRARAGTGLALVISVTVLAAACSSGSPAPASTTFAGAQAPAGSWPYPNGDLANTRDAAGAAITSANVSRLQQAWTFQLPPAAVASAPGFGSLAAAPVVAGGVVYLQDLDENVYALSLASGKLKWEYQVNSYEKSGPGPDGVAVANGPMNGGAASAVPPSEASAAAVTAAGGQIVDHRKLVVDAGQGGLEGRRLGVVLGGIGLGANAGLEAWIGNVRRLHHRPVDREFPAVE